jgi:lon-related putative ATP-dependent protease
MNELLRSARASLTRAFESEEYMRREREIAADVGSRQEELARALRTFASERSFALEITPVGVVSVPIVDGAPLTPERIRTLAPDQLAQIRESEREIEDETSRFLRAMHQLANEARDRLTRLQHDVASFALDPVLADFRERYDEVPAVLEHLDAVRSDMLEHVAEVRAEPAAATPFEQAAAARPDLARYRVNLFVDNAETVGAPVIVERSPQYRNLSGRVDYRPTLGAMVTDFREVKAGSLHRANGGFLLLDALDVLRQPFSWDVLKRALRTREVRIENLTEQYSAYPTSTLRPEPTPLDVKVVLIGAPFEYQLLLRLDEDFRELFRVKADFAPDMVWSARNERDYAAFLSRWVHENGLRHFDRTAVARMIEVGARLTESQRRLTARFVEIADVATEASYVAEREDQPLVTAAHVNAAVRRRAYRSNRVEERLRELIGERTLVVETTGEQVGTVNGLSVIDLGDYRFGHPSRISARVSIGDGSIASIEREVELSGPIHSKGVLTLAGFLAGTYARDYPLALAATLAFEQSYDEVEGDSASSTELYALLSALSEQPLRQSIAVTGSVDQHGRIQAVGGVNEKIEGFYELCAASGLTGDQGVLIPFANLRNLMLREEVVAAAREGRFHVWSARTVNDGLELLTGLPAGRRLRSGRFSRGSLHALVDEKLRHFAATRREHRRVQR